MLCAISGVAPEVPVASRKSGNVFEKRLIESYIAENGSDPVNGEELSVEDLIELKSPRVVQPRPPTFTSIPSLLSALQNEWDALALETYTLKQQLSQTRQELSTALYQHDAAVRVIARLTNERDESRDALSKLTASGAATNGDAMQGVISDAVVDRVEATQQKLSSTRRKRPIPDGWVDSATLSSFDVSQTTESIVPTPTSLDISEDGVELIGGSDGTAAIIVDGGAGVKPVMLNVGGTATHSRWWGPRALVASSTGTITVFERDGTEVGQLKGHAGPITSLSLHPCGDLLGSTGSDKSWILYDLTTLKTVTQINTDSALSIGEFHPDGHLFAAGGARDIKLFDVKTGASLADFDMGGSVASLSFSENGTWLASVAQGSEIVQVWDLRKSNIVKSLNMGSVIQNLQWDYTGQYLAVTGPGCVAVQQYTKSSKAWSEPFRKALAGTAVHWGANAATLKVLTPEGSLATLGAS